MNAVAGLLGSKKALMSGGLIAAGQAMVQLHTLPATWWWAGSCALAVAYVIAHAVQQCGKPAASSAAASASASSGG